jgi:DNA topoisomerase-3
MLRERDGDEWKQTFRVGRMMCQKPITRENAIQLITDGKTELIKAFISKKGRPFDAFLKREGARKFSWEFPPARPKIDKDGNPIERKAKARPIFPKPTVIGESKLHGGELVQAEDAYYVRKPDQDNRQVFKLSKKLCEIDIHPRTGAETPRPTAAAT